MKIIYDKLFIQFLFTWHLSLFDFSTMTFVQVSSPHKQLTASSHGSDMTSEPG